MLVTRVVLLLFLTGADVVLGSGTDATGAAKTTGKPEVVLSAGEAQVDGRLVGYRIGAGDVLQIVVWKEPDASVSGTVVRADGKISVPLIKEIEVLGLTPAELEKVLAEKFEKFIHGADVTVVPKEIHSRKAYVLGAVKKEGPVELHSAMTVLEAITDAGGLTEYARTKKIYVLRKGGGKQTRLPFNYEAVIRGERMEDNVTLVPGDLIVVPH